MINKVQTIESINGINGDCPEFAAAGMLAGIMQSYHGLPTWTLFEHIRMISHRKLYTTPPDIISDIELCYSDKKQNSRFL